MGAGPHTLSPDPEQDAQHAPPPAHHPNPELLQGTPPGSMIPNATQAPHQVGQQHVPQHVAPQPHPALLQHATSILLQSMPTFANALNTNPHLAQLLIAQSSPPNLLSIHQLWDVAGCSVPSISCLYRATRVPFVHALCGCSPFTLHWACTSQPATHTGRNTQYNNNNNPPGGGRRGTGGYS